MTNLTQFFISLFIAPLHVSSITVLIIRGSNCINTSSGMISLCEWLLGMAVRRERDPPTTKHKMMTSCHNQGLNRGDPIPSSSQAEQKYIQHIDIINSQITTFYAEYVNISHNHMFRPILVHLQVVPYSLASVVA